MVFDGKSPNPTQTLILVNNATIEFLAIKTSPKPNSLSVNIGGKSSTRWRPFRANVVKINSDASFSPATGAGSSGFILRDYKGRVISGSTSTIYASSPFVAEAVALREGISVVTSLNIKLVVVESDYKTLVDACKDIIRIRETDNILCDIESLKLIFTSIEFIWTSREGNSVVDLVAKLALNQRLPPNWISNPPIVLFALIASEFVED